MYHDHLLLIFGGILFALFSLFMVALYVVMKVVGTTISIVRHILVSLFIATSGGGAAHYFFGHHLYTMFSSYGGH